MTIEQGNKLIAEFMGLRVVHDGIQYLVDEKPNTNYLSILPKYHSSWNWLIPVVKKCKETHENGYIGSDITMALRSLEVESLWKAVVAFIEWYNKTGKPV